jgi:hypothetical protein
MCVWTARARECVCVRERKKERERERERERESERRENIEEANTAGKFNSYYYNGNYLRDDKTIATRAGEIIRLLVFLIIL